MRTVLDRLGPPEDIVEAANRTASTPTSTQVRWIALEAKRQRLQRTAGIESGMPEMALLAAHRFNLACDAVPIDAVEHDLYRHRFDLGAESR